MSALLRYQATILARSYRWIVPLVVYALLVAVGDEGATQLASGLDWSAAMLVPAVALLTRSALTAEPDAARAVVAAAAGPRRAQVAALIAALGFGAVLALAGAAFEVLLGESVAARPAGGVAGNVAATAGHPATLLAGLATAVVCLLVGSAAGALCNPPLLRHPGAALLSTLTAVVIALVADVSPAAAALRTPVPSTYAAPPPHWPGLVPLLAALALAGATWSLSAWVAARRDAHASAA
ncbi:MAG TPA: hypothetical protein VH478_09685 [Trebonia sp.]|jgi:hypothetical protein|nr:hypothetical protein [Trebonia sp.]